MLEAAFTKSVTAIEAAHEGRMDTTSNVLEDSPVGECAAQIPPEEADEISNHLWASGVVRHRSSVEVPEATVKFASNFAKLSLLSS